MRELFEAKDRGFDVMVLKAKEPVLVVFGAPWCVVCKAMEGEIHAFAEEDYVKTVHVDLDACPEIAERYGEMLRSVPTFFLFKAGQVILELHGKMTKKELKQKVMDALDRTK